MSPIHESPFHETLRAAAREDLKVELSLSDER
jgi:hypothetical protein